MEERSVSTDIRRMQALIIELEGVIRRLELHQKNSLETTGKILDECNDLLAEVKLEFHNTLTDADEAGYGQIPAIPIEDPKLRKAWLALYRYHHGVTADTVAADMRRHRTTVSTYLNTLVLMQFAQKERIGHEIVYKAVLPGEKGKE
ncbi:MAG: hypothetical protein WC586_03520 [Methanoregula sp.]